MKKATNGLSLFGGLALSLAGWCTACPRTAAQTAAEPSTPTPIAVELQPLQGTWEGIMVGDQAQQKITITITGNSLHFHRDKDFWFETAITLPAGKDPKQLHATIKDCPASADSIGEVVRAFFKIEEGKFTLATMGDDSEETPKGFEAAVGNRYELRKVQPQKKSAEPPKPSEPKPP